MVSMWVVSAAGGPPTSGLVSERSTWRYDGCPGAQMPLETFEDCLRAEFFKQEAKGAGGKHKLTAPVFLQEVPSWLDHEALEVWSLSARGRCWRSRQRRRRASQLERWSGILLASLYRSSGWRNFSKGKRGDGGGDPAAEEAASRNMQDVEDAGEAAVKGDRATQ
jgi:hypothetical protein